MLHPSCALMVLIHAYECLATAVEPPVLLTAKNGLVVQRGEFQVWVTNATLCSSRIFLEDHIGAAKSFFEIIKFGLSLMSALAYT